MTHAYWLAVLIPLLMPASFALRDLAGMTTLFAWLPLIVLFVVLPLIDWLIGRDETNPQPAAIRAYPDILIPLCAALTWLPVLAWSIWVTGRYAPGWSTAATIGWILSLGDIGGIAAINVAHELIHRRQPWQRALGGVLLSSVNYAGFKIEHPKWHHVKVATPEDPSSASRGENIYRQIPRAMTFNTVRAWWLAVQGARSRQRRLPWIQHEMTAWWLLSGALALLAWWLGGAWGVLAFIAQGLVAVSLLEIINFIEHYGLRRGRRADGRYEPPGVQHSWNADFWLSNAVLLQLQRHPDHHVNPSRPFSTLQTVKEAPQLPMGYAALSLLALAPPLWRKVIHPLLDSSCPPNESAAS
jgi:alkane 1-monooxygenase